MAAGPARVWLIEGCEGSVFTVATLSFPLGRVEAQWERDEPAGYSSLAVVLPPRYVSWYADGERCDLEVGIAGAMRQACPFGPPGPPPPSALLP